MICPSEEINTQESSYLANLDGVINWTTSEDGTGLELTNVDGDVLAQYVSEDVMTILTVPNGDDTEVGSGDTVLSTDDGQGVSSGAFGTTTTVSASLAVVAIMGLFV